MPLVKLGKRRLVVIPQSICDQLDMEIGDFLELQIEGNRVVMIPKKIVDAGIVRGGIQDIKPKVGQSNSQQ